MIPFRLPDRDFPRFRLMNRGPVMEAEAREKGGAFSHLMSRDSAELLSGFLIKLKIEGRLDLSLRVA